MSIKRTIIVTVLALAMVAMVAPVAVKADTLSDLMAQIVALQAQIAALQGGATPVPTGNVACAGVTFKKLSCWINRIRCKMLTGPFKCQRLHISSNRSRITWDGNILLWSNNLVSC